MGQVGELWLGSESAIARGYLGRPEQTAARFLEDPEATSVRWYRTGDAARWREDGVLEFLGRVDRQVSVRGWRVEPEEVERTLLDVPGVRAAAVDGRVLRGRTELVAWVVLEEPRLARTDLVRALRERLMPAMIPTLWRLQDEIPLTDHGKVDYAALQVPEASEPGDAPDARDALAVLWMHVLGVRRVAPEDDFFALGGTSLGAVRMLARVHRELGVYVELSDFMCEPTLRALRALCEEAKM